jgi:tripartite-type tricarboxylate transporter receptor subunit TctC
MHKIERTPHRMSATLGDKAMKWSTAVAAALVCASTGAPFSQALAQQEPAVPKLMTIVVPFPPGGSNDVFARVLAEKMSARLHNSVIVENRPGAGGSIGADYVSRASKDGSVLLLSSSSFTTNAAVQPKIPYDVVTSFTPVAMLASSPMALVVSKESRHSTLKSLLEEGRKEPGKVTYGSAGVGSINQMASEILASEDKTSFMHVPYKGMSPAMNDLAANRVDFVVASFTSVSAMLKGDRIRVLGVTSAKRSPFYPDVAAIGEALPGYSAELWWGVLGPAGMQPALVNKLNADIRAIVTDAKMRQMFAEESAVPSDDDAAQFAALVKSDAQKWKQVAQERHISVD